MSGINWEQKYKTLKKNFLSAIDIAYRNGFEQGYEQAVRDQFEQQQAMMQQQMANPAGKSLPPQNIAEQMQSVESDQQENSSISSKIDELDNLLNKTEKAEKLKENILGMAKMFNKNLNYQQQKNLIGQEKMVQDIINKWKKQKELFVDEFAKEIKKT